MDLIALCTVTLLVLTGVIRACWTGQQQMIACLLVIPWFVGAVVVGFGVYVEVWL